MKLTHGSLFAGIGGFDLGFERVGFKTIWQVENNTFCQKILAKNFPFARRFGNIKDCGKHNLITPTVISGGFPCQDISVAGRQAGIDGKRSGLWKEMYRIVGELRPDFVVVENVAALLSNGMGRVLGDISTLGYDAEWEVIPASAIGACHKRERVFLVAYPSSFRRICWKNNDCECSILRICNKHWLSSQEMERWQAIFESRFNENSFYKIDAAISDCQRIKRSGMQTLPQFPEFSWCKSIRRIEDLQERSDLPEPLVRRIDDGISPRLDALGNAVIPQIAEWIAWMIRRAIEDDTSSDKSGDATISGGSE